MAKRFVIMISIFLLLNGYVGWHGMLAVGHSGFGIPSVLYWVLFVIIAFGYLTGRVSKLGAAGRLLKNIGAYYLAFFEFAVLLLPFADLAGWIMKLSGMETGTVIQLLSGTVLAIIAVLMVRGSYNAWSPIVRKHVLQVDKPAQEGGPQELRVAMASDLHLGTMVGNRHLRKLVHHMNAMEPDVVLLAGDVLDDVIEPFLRNRMADTLKQLKAKHGIYAVLGNHEYYGGHIEQYVQAMEQIGIQVLQDETVTLPGLFHVAGRKDKTAEARPGRLSMGQLVEKLDPSLPILAMDHQPYGFAQAAEAGVDLLVCGHTHRGQFFPNHFFTRRLFELDWGYMRKGLMHVIVSSGFGSWGPPIRLLSRSEIIDIKVKLKA
ncbi:metallophosphoesterase [Paenibacillus sp. MMS18-CY102]|uniref:metallophosphoesterase n=1 Tax=Paenibacillus sp. MMS18-CY102 TaxID=2682849 RepID=UPI00136535B5|nr:metallophosphoesterase [Paenibacillus sp. MMS18-CY102]MWC27099.1 metallophosphoesterase [Paenibacillus sp. MMS18-CY102]